MRWPGIGVARSRMDSVEYPKPRSIGLYTGHRTAWFRTAPTAGSKKGIDLKLVDNGNAKPYNLITFPDKSGRVLVGDKVGIVYLLARDEMRKVFMDIHEKLDPTIAKNGFDERGLL